MQWVKEICFVYTEAGGGLLHDESSFRMSVHRLRSDGAAFQVLSTLRTALDVQRHGDAARSRLWEQFISESSPFAPQTGPEFVKAVELFRAEKDGAYL